MWAGAMAVETSSSTSVEIAIGIALALALLALALVFMCRLRCRPDRPVVGVPVAPGAHGTAMSSVQSFGRPYSGSRPVVSEPDMGDLIRW